MRRGCAGRSHESVHQQHHPARAGSTRRPKVQGLIPNPTNPNLLVNNYQGSYIQERVTGVPSFKIDQVINSKNKFSLPINRTRTQCDFCAGAEGFPAAITAAIGTYIRAHTERLNWDTIVSPTVLVHWGIGYTQNWLGRPALFDNYDALAGLGLSCTLPVGWPHLPQLHRPQQHPVRRSSQHQFNGRAGRRRLPAGHRNCKSQLGEGQPHQQYDG